MPKSSRWLRVNKEQVSELKYVDKDLIEGEEYVYRVLAVNKVGEGPPTDTSKPVLVKDPFGKSFYIIDVNLTNVDFFPRNMFKNMRNEMVDIN